MKNMKVVNGYNLSGGLTQFYIKGDLNDRLVTKILHTKGRLTCDEYKKWIKIAHNMLKDKGMGSVSDGYHTFDELYHHRALLFASLCNRYPERAWKSKRHNVLDGPMYENMFIVGINTPYGQASYHYDIDPYWDMFNVPEYESAPVWDGHSPSEAIDRIYKFFENNSIGNEVMVSPIKTHIDMIDDFTTECDKYLLYDLPNSYTTYWIDNKMHVELVKLSEWQDYCATVPFRYPGATRGHIVVGLSDGSIKSIKFYDTAYSSKIACYDESIRSLETIWIGKKLKTLANIIKSVVGLAILDGRQK